MSQKKNHKPRGHAKERRLSVRSELRAQPDLNKIANAVLAMAMAQAEKEAQAARAEQEVKDDD